MCKRPNAEEASHPIRYPFFFFFYYVETLSSYHGAQLTVYPLIKEHACLKVTRHMLNLSGDLDNFIAFIVSDT